MKHKNNNKEETVGQKVYDILSASQPQTEVQEIIDEYTLDYNRQMQECVDQNIKKFDSPFYVVVLTKKEYWAPNVVRNFFIARQTKPSVKTMWAEYTNFMHTVYEVTRHGDVNLLYTLPSPQEANTILESWASYDQNLVKWCRWAFEEMAS